MRFGCSIATIKLRVFVGLVRAGAALAPGFPVEEASFDRVVGPTASFGAVTQPRWLDADDADFVAVTAPRRLDADDASFGAAPRWLVLATAPSVTADAAVASNGGSSQFSASAPRSL